MKIGIIQYNPVVGDIYGNLDKMERYIKKAKSLECDLVVFPELSLIGSPPRDLLYNRDLLEVAKRGLYRAVDLAQGIGIIIGTIIEDKENNSLYNSALLLEDGIIKQRVDKALLENYDVFDESRYFKSSKSFRVVDFQGIKIGLTIGDMISGDKKVSLDIFEGLYRENPHIFINISAFPYYYGRVDEMENGLTYYSKKYQRPFIYVNQVGANDELVFNGGSMIYNSEGDCIQRCRNFEEDMITFNMGTTYTRLENVDEDISWIHDGLILGVKDYFRKSGFTRAILGISGGVDSAIAAYICAKALGKKNVLGVAIPSRYTSGESMKDARALAQNLGIEYKEIDLEGIFQDYLNIFNPEGEPTEDLAEENIQARIRGSLLMFIANREGRVLICPTNKSEMAIGYTTLYGDAAGGIAPMGDLFKTQVYDLCRYVNRVKEVIPENIIEKAPTAELKTDQKDEDSLPAYHIMDGILRLYIEEGLSFQEILSKGYDRDITYRIINMVQKAEYKHRQLPPVIKLSRSSFGIGRRYPIVGGFRLGALTK